MNTESKHTTQLVGSNVVITAQQFNPSILNLLWLAKNGIINDEKDLEPGSVFVEPMIQLKTHQFILLVVPEQLQFVPVGDVEDEKTLIVDKLGKIVSQLPHTPYTAIGFNFVWHMTPKSSGIPSLSRKLFFKNDSPFFTEFDTKDARFGGYLSKDFSGCRLKLDIKPITVAVQATPQERLQFAFNYHKELTASATEPVQQITEMLQLWATVKAEALRIINTLEEVD